LTPVSSWQIADKNFKRFASNQPVGLRHSGYVLTLDRAESNASGDVTALYATCAEVGTVPKPKAFIHWVSGPDSNPCEIRIYSRL